MQQPIKLCANCGRFETEAKATGSINCNPPFTVQPHSFTKEHPYLTEEAPQLTLEAIMEVNAQRCDKWHKGKEPWTPERWITAIVGELGEMANITKKLFRVADGSLGLKEGESVERLEAEEEKEWADTMLYMLLFAHYRGFKATEAIRHVFNAKSEQLGFEERL